MIKILKLPDIPKEERTPIVIQLLEIIHYQAERIQALMDEIAILKGNKPRPTIKPSQMDKSTMENKHNEPRILVRGKRSGSAKRSKTEQLIIHETVIVPAEGVPQGSKFKGYKDFIVQGMIIQPHNTCYRMERWEILDGSYVEGKLPSTVQGHFDSTLISYILYQYYQCHVTQPLLLEELHEFGVDISSGQINGILVEGKEDFHAEKEEMLRTGLEISAYINVDDTGARYNGKNGFCTQIGNDLSTHFKEEVRDLFAYFGSTETKSRINFLNGSTFLKVLHKSPSGRGYGLRNHPGILELYEGAKAAKHPVTVA